MERSSRASFYIAGVGARTHVGLDALQVVLAGRAEKLRPRESHMIDSHGEPVGACRMPILSDRVFGVDRYADLLRVPLYQASLPWLRAHVAGEAPKLPLILAVTDTFTRGVDEEKLSRFVSRLLEDPLAPLDGSKVRLVREGRAGGVRAVLEAERTCRDGADAVLVAGVDSYFDPDIVEHLDAEYRLHGLQTENGVIPGEGAGALLITRSSSIVKPMAAVLAGDVQLEPRPWGSEEPCHGLGMSLALRSCCEKSIGADSRRIRWMLTDVANERHRVDEWQLAFGRQHRAFGAEPVHEQPLLGHGELGAAVVPVCAAMLCTYWQLGIGHARLALVAAHSESALRGALILEEYRS